MKNKSPLLTSFLLNLYDRYLCFLKKFSAYFDFLKNIF